METMIKCTENCINQCDGVCIRNTTVVVRAYNPDSYKSDEYKCRCARI